jgi:hypothetical protein
MERPKMGTGTNGGVGRIGTCPGTVLIERDDRIDRRVEPFDPGEKNSSSSLLEVSPLRIAAARRAAPE